MSVIYKYPIELDQKTEQMYIRVPRYAIPISVMVEDTSVAFVYCLVDSKEKELVQKDVLWLGTGWELDQEIEKKIRYYNFLGTHRFKDSKNNLVWHFWIEPAEYKTIIE